MNGRPHDVTGEETGAARPAPGEVSPRGGDERAKRLGREDDEERERRRDRSRERNYGRRSNHRRARYRDRSPYRRDRRRRYDSDSDEFDHRRRRGADHRDNDADRGHHGGRRSNNKSVKHISVEDELAQLDRTMRTVQVFNLTLKAGERDIFEFFNKAGPLADIRIIKDKASGRSKGFAYVEFDTKEGADNALMLSGQELMGQAVMVKSSEAEKNVAWHTAQAAKKSVGDVTGSTAAQMPGGRIKLSNVHPTMTKELLKPIFEPYGPVFSVSVGQTDQGTMGGVVQFVNPKDAMQAVTELQGQIDIQGVVMALEHANDKELTGATAVAEGRQVEERLDLDADDGGGMKLSAQSRVELMSKLAATAGIEVPKAPDVYLNMQQQPLPQDEGYDEEVALLQGVLGPSSPIPTPCLLLKNAFDPESETGNDWEKEIEEDFREECSKFGRVVFVHVDPKTKGFVYLKFDSVEAATVARNALLGRWFNMKRLIAEYQFEQLFDQHFLG
jgi:RNA-binding protein 39